jgi:hypothetical protein
MVYRPEDGITLVMASELVKISSNEASAILTRVRGKGGKAVYGKNHDDDAKVDSESNP